MSPAEIAVEFLATDWQAAVREGDPERGRKLFGGDALACARCHAIVPGQAGAGAPSLSGAARRFTVAHLVESILLPHKQVAPLYRSTAVVTRAGEILTGLAINESDDKLELLVADGTRKAVDKKSIQERKLLDTSSMPAGLVKTPAELRDLLAYILSEAPRAP